ncbi:MAG: hypothetical protein LBE36_00580 [Flavobacteriaceae bacterium]|jgi:hypothetical protein|nr:hypothetical protein [Flavobacteriaceae bacterium]
MKNFDIELLERRNIFKTPENFFNKIQENVLQKIDTKHQTKTKIFKLNYVYAAAASLALIFGIYAIFSSNFGNGTSQNLVQIDTLSSETNLSDENTNDATLAYQTLKQDINSVEKTVAYNSKTKNTKSGKTEVSQKAENTAVSNSEIQYEQVLLQLSNTEISDLSNGAEEDVYLDLYY